MAPTWYLQNEIYLDKARLSLPLPSLFLIDNCFNMFMICLFLSFSMFAYVDLR